MKRRLKVNGIIIFFVVVLIAFFPGTFLRQQKSSALVSACEVFGIAFILLGQILRTSARGYKSENSRGGFALIQGGPYTLVRNPMYLGIVFIGLGVVSLLFKWWVAGIFLSVFILRYISLIFREEEKLSGLFAKEYPQYLKRVPRLLPSLRAATRRDTAEYLPLKGVWIKKEIGTVLTLLLVVSSIDLWLGIKHDGTRIYLISHAIGMAATLVFFAGLVFYLVKRTGAYEKDVSNKGRITL